MGASRASSFFALIGLDREIGYALGSRIVAAGGQFVTLSLVAVFMSPPAQGYHFTFLAFIAFQHFFELGFNVVLVNTAAHEAAHLSYAADGGLTGPDRSLERLASLLRLSLRWYVCVSVAFVIVALAAGWWFFAARPQTNFHWQTPWIFFVVAAGLQIWGNGALSFLEGCGKVAESYRIRLMATLSGQGASLGALLLGAELWVAATAVGVTAAAQIALAARHHAPLFGSLLARSPGHRMSWHGDLWPLQWRIALQGIAGGVCFSIFAPVAFYYHGPVAAGRIGVTWAIASGLLSLMISWVQVRAPRMAALVARGNDEGLESLFRRTMGTSFVIFVLALACVWAILPGLHVNGFEIASRFLPPGATAWLFAAVLVLQVSTTMSIYLRAHRADPSALAISVASAASALAIWAAGAHYGTTAMAMGYFLTIALLMLPSQTAIYLRYRRRWHPPRPDLG